jgi:hypothetical protein
MDRSWTNLRKDGSPPDRMPKEIEYAVVGLVTDVLGVSTAPTPVLVQTSRGP